MKTLEKIIVKIGYLMLYFGVATGDMIAGAVDIATDGKTNLEGKYRKALKSVYGINEEES